MKIREPEVASSHDNNLIADKKAVNETVAEMVADEKILFRFCKKSGTL